MTKLARFLLLERGSVLRTDEPRPAGSREYHPTIRRLFLMRPSQPGEEANGCLGARRKNPVRADLSVFGALRHLGPGRSMLTQFAAARKIPSPSFLVPFSGVWIVVASLSVLLGIYGDLGALMLALFTVSTALLCTRTGRSRTSRPKCRSRFSSAKTWPSRADHWRCSSCSPVSTKR